MTKTLKDRKIEKIIQINGTTFIVALTNKGNLFYRTPVTSYADGSNKSGGYWEKIDLPEDLDKLNDIDRG